MSTISIAPAHRIDSVRRPVRALQVGGAAPRTRLRLTSRGRRLLASVVALPLAAAIGFAAMSGGSALASGESAPAGSFETVVVMPGDTLWSIAAEVAPAADPRDVIDAIVRLNVLEGGVLVAGEELAIPAEYTR